MLFAAGVFAASGSLKIMVLYILFIAAAFLGDTANYHIGYYIGPKAFKSNTKFLKKEHLEKIVSILPAIIGLIRGSKNGKLSKERA